jgi:ABC-type multidrug transport system permease subunit
MIKTNPLLKPLLSHWHALSPNVVFHMISEIIFPRKILILCSLLLLSVFLLLITMIQGIVPATFELLLIAFIVTIASFCLWVIGLTGYVGNIRA